MCHHDPKSEQDLGFFLQISLTFPSVGIFAQCETTRDLFGASSFPAFSCIETTMGCIRHHQPFINEGPTA